MTVRGITATVSLVAIMFAACTLLRVDRLIDLPVPDPPVGRPSGTTPPAHDTGADHDRSPQGEPAYSPPWYSKVDWGMVLYGVLGGGAVLGGGYGVSRVRRNGRK